MAVNFHYSSSSGFKLHTFSVGPLQCNCTILWDPQTLEALVIDPGDEFNKIKTEIDSLGVKLKAILHTHAHFDHIGASHELHQNTQAPLYLNPTDRFLWENSKMQGQMFGLSIATPPAWHHDLEDEMEMAVSSHCLKTIFTPGHTPGSSSFVIQNILFSGDTLFDGSIGRTDLQGGDFSKISSSIKNRFYTLDSDTIVICGHGPNTTIGKEKRTNPFVSL